MYQEAALVRHWPLAACTLPGWKRQTHIPYAACRAYWSINQRAIFLACLPKYDSWPKAIVSLHFLVDSGILCKLLRP